MPARAVALPRCDQPTLDVAHIRIRRTITVIVEIPPVRSARDSRPSVTPDRMDRPTDRDGERGELKPARPRSSSIMAVVRSGAAGPIVGSGGCAGVG